MRKVYQIGPDKNLKGGIATVINDINQSSLIKENYEVINIPTIDKKKYICFFYSIIKIFKIEPNSILHFHVASNGSFIRKYILFKLSKKNCKKIFHLHGGGFIDFCNNSNRLIKLLIEDMLKKSNLIINVSDYMRDSLVTLYPDIQGKCIRIYNGINSNEKDTKFQSKEDWILFMGKLEEHKGIYDLIEILDLSADFIRESSWKVKIAGNGDIDQIKKIVNNKRINDFTEVIGWIQGENKRNILKKSKIFIIPSHVESFGIAAVEAMQLGNVILSSDAGALPEIIGSNNGYVINKKDYREYSKTIKKLIHNNSLLEKICKNNIDYARGFSTETMIESIIEQYELI